MSNDNIQHGIYWIISEGQDTSTVFTDYGTKTKSGANQIPLRTIEAPDEFEKTDVRIESVRYFEARNKETSQ